MINEKPQNISEAFLFIGEVRRYYSAYQKLDVIINSIQRILTFLEWSSPV